jgi:hypothetical protein
LVSGGWGWKEWQGGGAHKNAGVVTDGSGFKGRSVVVLSRDGGVLCFAFPQLPSVPARSWENGNNLHPGFRQTATVPLYGATSAKQPPSRRCRLQGKRQEGSQFPEGFGNFGKQPANANSDLPD